MTAPGVMTNNTPAGALLNGLSFQGMSEKISAKGSFEKIMETAQGSKKQEFKGQDKKARGLETQGVRSQDPEKKEVVSGRLSEQAESVKEQGKAMFSGKGRMRMQGEKEQVTEPSMEQDEAVDTAVMEAVSTLVVQIRELICETLDISDEELSQTMEDLDMKASDLFDRNRLQELFLVVNQAEDPAEFLTNEALFDDFAGMMQAVEQMIREADLTPETVSEVLTETELLPEQTQPGGKEPVEDTVLTVVAGSEVRTETDSDTETDTDTKEAVPAFSQADAENAQGAKEVRTEVRAETNDSKTKSHVAVAKGTKEEKVVSTETDGSFKAAFIDALTSKVTPAAGSEEALAATQQLREIVNQVLEQIKVIIRPEQTNMELQLNPEHLGRVHLTITEKEGMMTAQFTTQTQMAKEAIESQMAILKESLLNQGIKVEAIEVAVSEFGFERDRDANRNNGEEQGRRRRNHSLRSMAVEEDVPKMEDYINATDSSVDYSA